MAFLGTWPFLSKNPDAWSFGLRSNVPVHTSPLSGDAQRVYLDGAKWVASWRYNFLPLADAAVVEAFASRLRGPLNTFGLTDLTYLRRGTFDTASGTYNATYAKGATSVAINGGGGQASRTLLAGDRFSDSDGDLYMVVADATANGSGVITVTIEPPLRVAKASGSGAYTQTPNNLMMLTSASWSGRAVPGYPGARSYEFEAVSTLNA